MNKATMINLAIVIIMFCFFCWKTNNIEDKYNNTTEALHTQITDNTQELKNHISDKKYENQYNGSANKSGISI